MAQQDDNIKKLYDELQSTYDVGSEDDFRNYLNNAEHRKALYNELKNDYDIQDEKAFDDYLGYINGEKAPGTTKVGSVAQQVVNEYDQSAKDNAEAEEDLSAATSGAKIGGNISFAPAKPNNQQTVQPDVDNTAKSVMDASGTPAEQAKATGPKTQFVPEDPNYVQATPTAEALKKYPWMQPDQVYMWNRTTKEPVVTYVDESGHAVTDEDLQIKKAKSEITGQEDTEYMHPEAAALQLPNGNTRGVRLKKGALTQMADEIMRKEYGDNYLNTQFGRDGNVYTGAERRDLGAQQLYDELNSDVRNARISFAVADEKDRNEILSRIKAKWGKVADETSLVNAVSDENAAKEDIDIVAQQNINDLNAEIQNISRQMDQRGAEIDNASSPFVDQTFNARDVDAKYRLLQSKLNYAQNALKSWENVKNSGSLDALAGFKDAVMDISAWDFGFSDLKNAVSLLTAKGKDKQELVNLYGRSAEAAKFEDKYNPDSYRYGKIAGTSIPYALQFAGTDGGFKSIGSALSKKATSIAEKYALEGLKKQVVKGLGVAVGDIARAYTMSGTVQGLNTISDILTRSAGELTVDKQGNYQLKSDEPLLESIYKGVTASAIQNFTEMVGESVNISANLMRMLPKIGLGRVSNAITKIGTQDWYRVCNNWLSRAGVNDFGGEVLEEELSIILNAAFVGDNPLLNGSGGLLDVRTQKDILGGMLYSISAMRAGALAMYGVKKGVGSAFVKTLDMYDKMQLNQSDKGGQSIFGEGWTEIKDEIDNTPNDKVNAVIEKLAKEHPSKDEQSAIIDYAVKLLKTRGHNLGIAMASDGENDEGAQEEIKDMPDLSQPNAEYLNKDDGMIHKASLYPDASDPTGTAKDVFIIKGNLVTNEDGSINKDASDDTIIYIDGNGERHIASPDKFAAAYPPMSNNEVLQANEGGENEEAQTTTFNKGDEVNINVDGNNYTATIQGTDGFGNYNVYYEDEIGMMHPAKFTADQLNEMNGKSTVSNGQQATSEQPADVQQQVEQPVVEQPAQQEQETQLAQQAQEEQKSAIPKDEKGNALYHQVPVETTINDLYDGKLDDNEIRDFVDANISEADKNLEKINKKAPKIGINKAEYLKKKQEWQKQVEDATRISDYWNSVKDYIAKQTHTTPEEVKAAQDELSGEAARREYQDMGGSVQQDAVSVASDFIRGAKITPESFKAETGYGAEEQRKFVGMIAKAENGGKTIDRLAEELVSYDNAEMNGVLFGGDASSAKDAILSALQGAGTRGELKQTNETEEQAYIDARNAARDAQYMEQYGMTYEEYLAYEEQIMPTIWREYNNYDETAFNNMYAEEIEQLIKSRENDTTGEEQADDRGNQVLSEQQVTEQRGSADGTEPGTEVQAGVQGTDENAVASEEAQQQAVAQDVPSKAVREKLWKLVNFLNSQYGYNFEDEDSFAKWISKKKNNIKWLKDKLPSNLVKEAVSTINDYIKLSTKPSISSKIATAEAETDTNPTEGQKEAGNYKKGHVRIDGYDITIEQPKGSVRRGTDADGKQWEQTMNNTYGYIRGTEGVDGDHIDIFLSDNPTEGNVYVVDQVNTDGSFDEHKVMYGFNSAEDARAAYLSNYEEGWQGLGTITEVSKEEFKKWVNSSKRKTKPFSEYKSVNAIGAQNEEREVGKVSPEILSFRQKKIDELNAVKDEDVKKGPSAWYFDKPLLVSAKTKKSAISKMHKRREDDIQSINNGSIDWMYNAIQDKGLVGYEEVSSVEEKSAEEKKPEYGANNKVVSKERYEELKKRMIKKLGQLNFGMDPELIEIGVEMTAYHLEAGARKFADYAKAMINDVGDVIRPYLKSLYNAARDYPDVVEAGLNVGMSTGDEVSKFDVTNFDKKTIDALATADNVVKEQNIKKETEKIIKENEKKSEQTAKKSVSSQKIADLFGDINGSTKSDAQRRFSDTVKSDMLSALDRGEKPYRSIVDLRKRASEVGMDVDNEGRSDILLQELVEDGLVGAAREVINKYGSDSKDSYDLICKLYDMQPTIAARSSNRIKMQQYSTPLPMAWNAAHFAMSGKQGGKVLEPTAGNGMLVFAVPANQVHANELDETRLNNLREQGFAEVTQQDATEPFEGGKQYDAIIANPPFGSRKAVDYDGKMIPGLDPQITLNALSSMKDDGKAAIIIGGNMEYAKNGSIKSMKPFFTYLYDRYNVKGVVDMDGKLYAKQGTTFPTRMILIDGRRSEEERAQTTVYPPVESKAVAKVSSFEELYNTVNDIINSKEKTNGTEILHSRERELLSVNNRPSGNAEGNRRPEQPRKNDTTGRGNKPEGSKEQSERVLPGERRKNTGDGETRNEVAGSEQRGSRGNNEPAIQRVGGERVLTERVGLKEEPKKRSLTEEKLPYRPHNTAFSLNSVAPSAMVEAMDKILTQIEKENGSIDEFVRKELGYDTIEEAHQALAAEQMDSVAMAIYQMKKGQALIIGDQTGVGKGRQMAALIRWAVKRGEKPIFITQKADLFSDIYRDLVDVGSGDLVPFIFNSDGAMVDSNGNVVHKPLSASAMSKVFASGELPDSYDFAVLTYSQVNTGDAISQKEAEEAAKKSGTRAKKSKASKEGKPTPKATFLRSIAKDNYLFLDESHTAAGSSNTGAYLQSILKSAKAATFASATFAKRPDTMPLYAIRTAMSQAKIEPEKLISIIEKGGVTLQEIMSRELTNAGQMVRRERDMSDVKTDWKTIDDPSTVKRARENYDKTIQAFNAIIKFQNDFVKPKIDDLDQSLAIVAQSAGVKKGTDKMGVENVPFASKTYNYTKQLMLALKVDAIADEVEKEINAGRHPVIALESTMESTIKDYAVGEVIKEPTFSASLLKGLDSVMQYTIKDENGKETSARYTPSDLGKAGEEAYYNLQKLIRESTSDIFISPLDAIIERLHAKGYKVGELTGRNLYVERNENGEVVVKRRTDKDKKKMQRDFNSGNLDVLILNKSASTGISLHASEKFKDQRQRTMIIAQPLSDINDYMQMIGRIDRTGQVHRGYYINLGLPVPAENRFLMMLSTKLKSLNANTTTSQESKSNEVEAPDLLNKYGSQVVVEYLRDNPEVYEKMGAPLKKGSLGSGKVQASELDEYKPQDDDARKITGYVALLSTKEQEDFYNDVVKRYNDLIQYLNDTGSNDLKINVMPLRAKTIEKRVSSEGIDPNGTNPFAQNAYVEKVEMDVLRKPMKAEEVRKTIDKLNKTSVDVTTDVIRKESDAKIASENTRYDNAREKALDDIQKHKEKIERSKKLSDEEKAAAINSYITDTNNTIEERHDKNLKKITDNRDQLIRRLRMFDAGKSYLVPDNLESMTFDFASPAIFCGYKAKESKVTASTTLAVFATLDSRRRIEIKLSDINALQSIVKMTMDNIDAARAITLDNWDSQIPTETRKEGYILTGNILQAIADSQDEYGGYTGHLVSYTDIDGNIHDGILMPDKWNTSLLKSSGAPLSARMEQIKRYEPIISSDGKVTLNGSQWAEMYYLTVPKTKKDGAMYYENNVLLDASNGEFYPYRGNLRADIPAQNIEGVVNELTKLGVKVRGSNDVVSEGTNDLYREADTEEEINSIIDKAKADGTYMKAPNGNPTNLNERQWAQVRTKAFKDWFGDWENDPENASKVVDENGEPKVVYHGTHSYSKFNTFELQNNVSRGFFFADTDKSIVERASSREHEEGFSGKYEVFLNLKNPLIIDAKNNEFYSLPVTEEYIPIIKAVNPDITDKEIKEGISSGDTTGIDSLTQILEKTNLYDGIIAKNIIEGKGENGITDYVAMKPNQIKSATDNTGAFNPEDDDIRYRFIGETGARNLDAAEEATTRLDNLSVAREMETAGKDAKSIKMATGWERGADGKWRYETADFEYHPRGDARRNDKYKESEWFKELNVLEEKLFNGETLTDGETKRFDELSARVNAIRDNDRNTERIYLDDYVEDNELFKAYPELKQTKIDFVDLPNEEYSAKYNEEENRITVNQAKNIDDKSAIAHEVQHAIQHIEGFAQGSNVDNYNSVPTSENVINDIIDATDGHILDGGGFDNTPEGIFNALNRKTTYGTILRDYSSELDDIANKYGYETIFDLVNDIDKFKSRVEMYLSEAGEVEARNVEARINMTPEQRRQSLASETEDVAREDQLFIYDNLGVSARQGTGALTDSELSNANDPAGKMLGKPSRTPAQQKAFAERERQRMADRAREVADILHLDNVEIVTDASTLQGRRAKAKGFYSRDNGKIVIVVPNHVDMADIEQTVLHEAVAHYGLRKLFGKNFDTFLYNVYNNASQEVREKISQLAAQHNWDFATATEEYLASLAEKTNFEDLNASWWDKIKSLFLKLLHSIGLKGFTGVSLTDNELRYILWRSYENLKNPGRYRSIIDEAKDITMQNELRVGNYSAGNSEAVGKAAENGVVNIEDVNRRFNEELGRLTEENAQSVILNLGRPGNFLLASGLSDRPIKLYGNKLLKKMRKHGFTTSDVKNLPKEINNPIAVFKGSVENSFAILTELEINGNNVLASISVGKGNDIDFNIISSVYGKNGNSVVSWINDGKILYVNKEKALNYLRISAPIAEAQDNQELSSAANIVKNFENPNISEENMRYGNGALAASESNGINKTNETNGQEAEEANRRFNEELNAFKAKTHKGLLHLGQPGRILNACGINEELTLSPTVLSRKLKQHGLNVDDIKGLAGAIQEPILVYQHGDAHPNMVIVTDLAAKGGKVSVAVELDGEGNVVELNNVSSVHSKGATTELERLSNMRDGYLEQALRWVDKNKVSDWLGIADLNSPIHANNPKLVSIANILQNFENPSVGEENILYREAKKVEKKINSDWRDEYDKKLSKFSFKLTEAAQDAMRSVKILQDIIAKETSAPIRDDENVYWRENRLSSVNKYEQEYYNENYCKPIVTEIANLVKYGARYNDKGEDIINSDKDVLKYLIAKSGLERNQSKREVEAMNARKPYEDQIKELQKQVEKEEIKEENANKKIAKLQEQADKAEMNKRVAVLHKDYSGLTELFQDEKDFDTLATSYVSDFEKKFDTESLWNAINRATKETLRKAFVDGLISRESYESTAKMYKYYIPLRGWANDVASEAYNYKGSGEGSRKILQTAKGRTSLADNPISEIGRMMQDAIFQGNRNRMKQAVYNLAMNHDTSLLNIKRQWYQNMGTEEDPAWERVFPDLNSDMTADQVAEEVEDFESRMRELKKEGKATQSRKGLILRLHTTKREEAQHRISVAINGKEYNIFVNGNPRAAQAINGELNDVDRYGSAVAKVNRFLSQVYTSINPEFVVTNYQRDAGFAASIVASTEPWSYQKEWAKNMTVYNPITTGVYLNRLIKKAKTGNINPSNKAERYMQEFLSNGGETGFTNMLSADDYKKQIKRDIKSINSVVSLPKAARAAVAFTERANTVFEDATRYATYVTSREQGRTIDRSIRDAKEISLNFNTRGADGLPGDGFIYRFFRGLRRWMIFVNPSIQGLNKAGMAFRNHPLRSSMMIAGLPTLLGYALPAIMQAVVGGGDGDDDDKNVVESYKDLPKWVRRTNIAIPIGGNNFVTIPLSYELRVSYGLGEMMWEYGEGMIDKDEIAIETLSQLSDLLPVSFANGTVAQSISPSIARPLIDIIQNRNFYGKKIYNDSQFIEGYPEYMKAYAGTPKWLVKSTEVLNNVIPNLNAGVSDKYTPGAINVNPAIIDYLLSSYLGGLYNFPSKFGKTISMIWDEDMRDIQNVPILSRNWKNSQSGNPYNSGDRYKTYMKEYDLSKQRFNGYKKEAKNDVPEFLNSLKDLLNTPSGKRMLMIDAYKRDGLDKLNRRIRDIDTYGNEKYEGEKDALTKRRDGLKEELINKLDSISDGTLDFVNGEWTRK